MRNIFEKFGREGKNPGGVASTPPLGVFGWRNTLGVCGLTLIGTRFSPHVKNQGGVKNTPEENLQYLGSLMSDFDEIFTVYSQMNLAYNRIKIF